jgi:hypothetical protein
LQTTTKRITRIKFAEFKFTAAGTPPFKFQRVKRTARCRGTALRARFTCASLSLH